ncbi:hypothetical protein NL676_002452 [Syzygium grande]|nr:hypothetical protein NL676_002452 [Syzygium grande]
MNLAFGAGALVTAKSVAVEKPSVKPSLSRGPAIANGDGVKDRRDRGGLLPFVKDKGNRPRATISFVDSLLLLRLRLRFARHRGILSWSGPPPALGGERARTPCTSVQCSEDTKEKYTGAFAPCVVKVTIKRAKIASAVPASLSLSIAALCSFHYQMPSSVAFMFFRGGFGTVSDPLKPWLTGTEPAVAVDGEGTW